MPMMRLRGLLDGARMEMRMRVFKKPEEGEPLSAKEFQRLVERRTRYYFDMSVPEFRAALHEGRLGENLAATEIALLLGETAR